MINCPKCKYMRDEKLYSCPCCHYAITEDKSVRVAQYGGVGGGSSWSPGLTPNNHDRNSGGQFHQTPDNGLDAIMGATRLNVDDDNTPDINLESRLEQFHKYFEVDKIPELPFKERQELKRKQNEQRRKKFQEDSDKSLITNSPAYIKQYYNPKPEQLIPMENSLDGVRANDEIRQSVLEDIVYVLDSEGNQRAASVRVSSPKIRHNIDTIFGPHDEQEEVDGANNPADLDYAQFHNTPLGNSGKLTPMFSSQDVEKYLDGDGVAELNGFLEETTDAFDYPNYDEVHYDGEAAQEGVPSPFNEYGAKNNVNTTIEGQLSKLDYPAPPQKQVNIPGGMRTQDEIKGQEGTANKYPSIDNAVGLSSPHPSL